MNRSRFFVRLAVGGLFVLLPAILAWTAPASAYEPPPIVIGTGGGGGGTIIPGTEGDPTDGNEYVGDPVLPGGDYHEDMGSTSSFLSDPEPLPGISLFGVWNFHLVFDPYRGMPVPSLMAFWVATPRGF